MMNHDALPPVTLTVRDFERLEVLLRYHASGQLRGCPPAVIDFLHGELLRADIVDDATVPGQVVTMNSRVRYRDEHSGREREVTLVYPGCEDLAQGRISILSPVGSALIGLSEGQAITFALPNGQWCSLRVERVAQRCATP
jgi:regulator of nucleoside diphosphate kinase